MKSSAVTPLFLLALASPATADENTALWRLLEGGGQVLIMRHAATEPGVGDPPGFRLDDCTTQESGAFRVAGRMSPAGPSPN